MTFVPCVDLNSPTILEGATDKVIKFYSSLDCKKTCYVYNCHGQNSTNITLVNTTKMSVVKTLTEGEGSERLTSSLR